MGNNNKIALARFRIANLEQIIKEIQVRHQADKESLVGNSLLRDDITELPYTQVNAVQGIADSDVSKPSKWGEGEDLTLRAFAKEKDHPLPMPFLIL
ncbi:hypothetical protein Tco_1013747 [Tanacetum coccineum]